MTAYLQITPSPEGQGGVKPEPTFRPQLFFYRKNPTGIPGVVRGTTSPPDRSGNAPDRYTAFFAKLFFTWKKSVTPVKGWMK